MADKKPSLMERLMKISTVKETAIFAESTILQNRELTQTDIPLLNIALSGALDGGLSSGVNAIAGPSKHFKSLMALLMAKAFLNKYADAIMVLVDSEFGTLPSYVKSMGIDPTRIIHVPVSTIEQARHELSVLLNEITRKDNIVFVFDSVGNLASAKETEDALSGKDTTDMTRAKVMKSMFRIITPMLVIKDIPMLVINHTYLTQEKYAKTVMSGGTGIYYSATNVWFMGREQEKEDDEIVGYTFSINIDKSRYVREKSKLKLTVTFDGGIEKYSGIWDLAIEAGIIKQGSVKGKYQLCDPDTGVLSKEFTRKELDVPKVMSGVVKMTAFQEFVRQRFQLEAPKSFEEMMAEADAEEGPELLMEEGAEDSAAVSRLKKAQKKAVKE